MTRSAMPPVSALTLARGRATHLRNLVIGLTRQTRPPSELVIGVMQEDLYDDLPATSFPVRQVRVRGRELPLARARNRVAEAAHGEVLAFLDVDCIPAPKLIADYARMVGPSQGLSMGEVLYLPAGAAAEGWTYDRFAELGVRHCDRQGPPEGDRRRCEDYRCFWSLNFALHRRDWDASGGFDTRFVGYGGEDTDFGRSLSERGIPIWWVRGARVYHQYHPHCMPPIHHIPSIIRNAELFAQKWGHRTMEHWLHAFRMMGLIEPTDAGLRILRAPDAEDFALCRQQEDMPYAASGRVMRLLQDRARAQAGLPPDDASPKVRQARLDRGQREMLTPAGRAPFAAE
ncbi:glycosyltransferase [Jannaschia sp. S6380]|uniref:glycosyltransferase family 2 protein n=1 Tax=Jannaschia sp. S6380 TaxID=2926408 RepID=UPI001FF3EB11|nr:galactosyltransferase-related protein [Jannaschia sp. S6380]MCK0168506.1 glycosyltransferase [Jannaschia sp. S6380]